MSKVDRITRWCPVCQHGASGYCDERCETREANGQPGHFPGQLSVSMRNAPSWSDAVILAEHVRVWRRLDNELGA